MATQSTHPVFPQYATVLQFYDHPPTGNTITGDHGSSSTSQMSPCTPPDARELPRHIMEDQQMCRRIMESARTYLTGSTTLPGPLPHIHYVAQIYLRTSIGDETRNIDMFGQISAYVRQFVQIVDRLGPDDIEVVPCDSEGGIRPNRKMIRQNTEKIIVELKSIAAFDRHAGDILDLAHGNNGHGTEIIYDGNERGARSIIFKVCT
jgi:hypothetical protein